MTKTKRLEPLGPSLDSLVLLFNEFPAWVDGIHFLGDVETVVTNALEVGQNLSEVDAVASPTDLALKPLNLHAFEGLVGLVD